MRKLAAIARAVPDARLRIDANRSWPDADVRALIAETKRYSIDYIEEPCSDSCALVLSDHVHAPIALDESLVGLSLPRLAELLASRWLAAIVVKPTLHGLLYALYLARRAKRVVISHALEGPIGMAACCELALACGHTGPMGLAPHPALDGWNIRPPQLDGLTIRPAKVGLGIDASLDGIEVSE